MLKKLISKLNIFNKDNMILPSFGKPNPTKLVKVSIFVAKKPDDINKLRKKLEKSSMVFINISSLLVGTERKSFVNRLKMLCKSSKMKLYGIDRAWIVAAGAKLESY